MLCSSVLKDKIPYFNAPIYLENKSAIGKVDEILGPINEVYFSVKMGEGMVASSFQKGDKVYIGADKLLPLERFLPKPKEKGTLDFYLKPPQITLLLRVSPKQPRRWSSDSDVLILTHFVSTGESTPKPIFSCRISLSLTRTLIWDLQNEAVALQEAHQEAALPVVADLAEGEVFAGEVLVGEEEDVVPRAELEVHREVGVASTLEEVVVVAAEGEEEERTDSSHIEYQKDYSQSPHLVEKRAISPEKALSRISVDDSDLRL